jgi:hypothetical protein
MHIGFTCISMGSSDPLETYIADWTPTSEWKEHNGCCPREFSEVHHYVSWEINFSGGNALFS